MFNFANNTQRRNLEAFILALDTGLRPVVGQQVSSTSADFNSVAVNQRVNLLVTRADAGDCDLVVHAVYGGQNRGLLHLGGGLFQPDRATDPPLSLFQLGTLASVPGQEQVFTCVPPGMGTRVALDRDEDGFYDRDELDAGSDPADPASVPSSGCSGTPQPGCRAAGRGVLQIKADPGHERLKWKWLKGAATDTAALGNPVTSTAYALCIYAGTANSSVLQAQIAAGGNWKATSSGFKYKDVTLAAAGIQQIVLRTGEAGRAKVTVKGLGSNLPVALPPQGLDLPVRVQLQNTLGECWDASYPSASSNDGSQFKAKF